MMKYVLIFAAYVLGVVTVGIERPELGFIGVLLLCLLADVWIGRDRHDEDIHRR